MRAASGRREADGAAAYHARNSREDVADRHIVQFPRHAGAVVFGEDGIVYSRTSSRSVQPCSRRSPTSASSAPILVRSTTSVPSSAVVTTSA